MARIISLKQSKDAFEKVGLRSGDYIRLKNPNTQFVDVVTGFHLVGNQSKRVPDSMSQKMAASIRAGRFEVVRKNKKGEADK